MGAASLGHYWVGIDLGTTHTVVAYRKHTSSSAATEILKIPQWIGLGEIDALPLLPSFRYHPAVDEFSEQQLTLPWPEISVPGDDGQKIIGEWARELSAHTEGRTVLSAKSWLSHRQVDRAEPILPWASDESVNKVSPVVASASYLAYLHSAWNHQFPDDPLAAQEIVITIPASFDEMARTLTLEAAKLAGLPEQRLLLLEEPQAVCYDWINRHTKAGDLHQIDADLMLVCDVGGGTTDLSLIELASDESQTNTENQSSTKPSLSFKRVGVGDHLMLGGDNIDLALAHLAEQRLLAANSASSASRKRLFTATTLSQLLQQTRRAKEALLASFKLDSHHQCGQDSPLPDAYPVTVLGRGASLVGAKQTTELNVADVRAQVFDGFFATCDHHDVLASHRSGLVEFGLPYVSDPCITKHIAQFLRNHQSVCRQAKNVSLQNEEVQPDFIAPDVVIFNGGVFKSNTLAKQLLDQLSAWGGKTVIALDNPYPELAVAYGAVAYLSARAGAIKTISGGSARTFLLSVDAGSDGSDAEKHHSVICLLPRGTETGEPIHIAERRFALKVGTPVSFSLFSSSLDATWAPGSLVELTDFPEDSFIALPPLVSALESKDDQSHKADIEVTLSVVLNDIGTIAIECVAVSDASCRWRLEFELNTRHSDARQVSSEAISAECHQVSVVQGTSPEGLPKSYGLAAEAIQEVFGKRKKTNNPKAVKLLRGHLEKWLDKRENWSFPLLRRLTDELLLGLKHRRRSEQHERIWFNLVGYGLRPGFGDALDQWRLEQVWPLYKMGLQFDQSLQLWSEWWIFWRRIAGGLQPEQQALIYQDVSKYINPAAVRNRKVAAELKLRSYEDMVRLVGSLEHLSIEQKREAGQWLFKRLKKASESDVCWWALGRLGARVPFYGSAHRVLPVEEVIVWLESMLSKPWDSASMLPLAATLMARKSGDRLRDVPADLAEKVIKKLVVMKASPTWIHMIQEGGALDVNEEKRVYGEALPAGLQLIAS